MTIRRGDVFRHELAGGGWGDPLERDPLRVLDDLRNELITERFAREAYGVVIDTGRWTVDAAGTRTLRAEVRARRGPGPLPRVRRGGGRDVQAEPAR
jgi:N-methylhydantoinase B